MITAEQAEHKALEYIRRNNEAVAQIHPLRPTVFGLALRACEAARDSALAGPEAAFVVVHRGFIPITEEEGNPYG